MMLEVWEPCNCCDGSGRSDTAYVRGVACPVCNDQDDPSYARHPGFVRVLRPVAEVLRAAAGLPT